MLNKCIHKILSIQTLNIMKYLYSLIFIFLLHYATFSQTLVTATPESQGMSTERLQRIDKVVNEYVDKSYTAGAVVIVVRNGKIVYFQFMEDTFTTARSFSPSGKWTIKTDPDGGTYEV